MIKIDIDGDKFLDNLDVRFANVDQALMAEVAMQSAVLAANIRSAITSTIGQEKAKHFKVDIVPSGYGAEVRVTPVDDVGYYIYHGTRPHTIDAGGQPMPVDSGVFAMSADHPGTEAMKPEIDSAVHQAINNTRAAFSHIKLVVG